MARAAVRSRGRPVKTVAPRLSEVMLEDGPVRNGNRVAVYYVIRRGLLAESIMANTSLRTPITLIVIAGGLFAGGAYLIVSGKAVRSARRAYVYPADAPFVQPTAEAVNRAIDHGTRAFIDDYVRPSYEAVSNGGYVDYTDAMGVTKRYGPDVYVQCQLYLLTHFAMYSRDFGVPDDDPLLINVRKWLVDQFDAKEGRWLWSEETCLHPKGMIALARMGRRDLVDKARAWAMRSPGWRQHHSMFSMMNSGKIIQTVGSAQISLTGRTTWEYGDPVPDAEYSTKFLYAVLVAGHTIDEPEIAELYNGIDRYFIKNPLVFGEVSVKHVMGLVWYVLAHHDFGLERGAGYDYAVRTLIEGVQSGGVIRSFELSRRFMGTRGMVVRAALRAGDRSEGLHRQVADFLSTQSASGAWLAVNQAWRLDRPPVVGMRMGQMNGANTYLTTLGLMAYRDALFGPPADASASGAPQRPIESVH